MKNFFVRFIFFLLFTCLSSNLNAFLELLPNTEVSPGFIVQSVSFNKDNALLAVSHMTGGDSTLSIYGFDAIALIKKNITVDPFSSNDRLCVNWQNAQNVLATCGRAGNGFLTVSEWSGNDLVLKVSNGSLPEALSVVAWNPNGTLLAVGSQQNATHYGHIFVYSWNGSSLTLRVDLVLGHEHTVKALSWSPDGNFLAVAADDEHGFMTSEGKLFIYQWDSTSNSLTQKTFLSLGYPGTRINTVAWSPSGNRLAIGGIKQIIKVYAWDKNTFTLTQEYVQRFGSKTNNNVYAVCWDRFEGYLAASGGDYNYIEDLVVYKWDTTVSNSLNRVDGAKLGSVNSIGTSLSWSYDSLYLVVGYYLEASSEGKVKIFKTQLSYDQGKTINPLTVGPNSRDAVLLSDFNVREGEFIEINGSGVDIKGNGHTIKFSNRSTPAIRSISDNLSSFIVQADSDVTLDNITLSGLTQDTFDLKYRQRQRQRSVEDILDDEFDETREVVNNVDVGMMVIGDNVNFDLSQDCVLQSGLIKFRQRQRQRSISETSYLNITGVDGNQSFILDPSDEFLNALRQRQRQRQRPAFAPDVFMFDLTDGTLNLQDAGLQGTTNIRQRQRQRSIDFGEFGTIILDGNAEVLVGDSFRQRQRQRQRDIKIENENLRITQNVQVQPECGLDFIISGEGNKISMLDDNTLFIGQLVFASTGINSVEMRAKLTSAIVNPTDDPNRAIPQMGFGANFMNLASLDGTSELMFSNPRIRVDNETNGFLVGQNSTLIGNGVEIYGDSIRYQYDPLTESAPLRLAVKNLTASSEIYNVPLLPVLPLLSFSQIQNLITDKNDLEGSVKAESEKSITRQIGTNVISYYRETIDLGQAQGNVVLDQTIANNFSVDSKKPLNITLNNSSINIISTNIEDEAVTFKEEDTLHIVGKNNVIEVDGYLLISGAINFDDGSELTIKFLNPNSIVIIVGESSELNLGKNSKITFSGPGLAAFLGIINFNESTFILKDGAQFFPLFAYFKGIGDFELMSGAMMQILKFAFLNIGIFQTDVINLKISDKAMIRLGGDSNIIQIARRYLKDKISKYPVSNVGRLQLAFGTSSISVFSGGAVVIDDGGRLAINTMAGELGQEVSSPGNFEGISLSPKGQLSLKPGGKIIFAENKNAFNPIDKKLITWQADGTVAFDGADSSGNIGTIEFISPNSSFNFVGQMLFNNGNFAASDLSAQELVRRLVNRSSVLITAAELLDANNIRWVRLKNGRKIQMQTGDAVLGENTDGSVQGKSSAGRKIIFTLTGVRQVI